ncbi:hypothetical protein C7N43_37265 [Sphingobacteriales bacterium UPWRP_1]|nr:hypothetical protein B6N25_16195 [Sphingobacteriales bacterium TSM_CSS]PSJ71847.1 hypothetical protein C7N43_37265 [Sphingobacteriales bacterium UPWRP_1]
MFSGLVKQWCYAAVRKVLKNTCSAKGLPGSVLPASMQVFITCFGGKKAGKHTPEPCSPRPCIVAAKTGRKTTKSTCNKRRHKNVFQTAKLCLLI